MYESPIEIVTSELTKQLDGGVLTLAQSYGVRVDKDKLIMALNYDRQQYEKGFADGKAAAGNWIPCTERMPHNTGDFYLCTAKLSVDDEYEVELLMLDTANDFDKSYFSNCIHNGLVFRESWSGGNEALDVIAWMPLPEPYRPEDRKDGEANAEYRD